MRKLSLAADVLEEEGCAKVLCVPYAGWKLILAFTELFRWKIYKSPDGDYYYPGSYSSAAADVVDKTIEGIIMATCVGDLVGEISEIIKEQMKMTCGNGSSCGCCGGCGCCCCDGSISSIDDIELPEPPADVEPPAPDDNWRCISAQQFVYDIQLFCTNAIEYIVAGIATGDALAAAAATVATLTGIAGPLALIIVSVLGAGAALGLGAVKDLVAELADQIRCAIYCSSTPLQAKNNVDNLVAYSSGGVVAKTVLRLLMHFVKWDNFFNTGSMEIDDWNYVTCTDCDCEVTEPTEGLPTDDPYEHSRWVHSLKWGTNAGGPDITQGSPVIINEIYSMIASGSGSGGYWRTALSYLANEGTLDDMAIHVIGLSNYTDPPEGVDGLAVIHTDETREVLDANDLPQIGDAIRKYVCNGDTRHTIQFWIQDSSV